jgi:serine/threonine-protein kinase
MGEVYEAYDLILGQDVALKFLPAGVAATEGALDRFRHEVRLARQVSHPNVCRVYDIGEVDGLPFLSMEYVDGEDLASLLSRIGRLPPDKALDIARRLCAGLGAAHEKGVLHRDLKPANIMIDGRGKVLITDFGLAAIAGSISPEEARQGTTSYMSPEQLAGREVTVRSDIYALGLVMYEVFTGKRPFQAKSVEELLRLQQESTPTSITSVAKDVEPAVERAILRCLAADPQQRPVSARVIARSLPGSEQLDAALAAGETPSPEMVAEAGKSEGLHPPKALAMFALIIASTIAFAATAAYFTPIQQTPLEYSPESLSAMAREHVRRLGYAQHSGDSAMGLETSLPYWDYARSHYSVGQLRAQMAAGRPAAINFWYRQSPSPLNPGDDVARVSMASPAFTMSGMLRLRLDLQGRLLSFEAVPSEFEPMAGKAAPPDWKPLFSAADLDPAQFQSAEPQWTPIVACDFRAAWTGAWPEAHEVPIRLEAAAWHGKLVSFRVIEPWTQAMRDHPPTASGVYAMVSVWLIAFVGVFLARRNLKLGRSDRRGAVRLAFALFCIGLPADLLSMSHVAGPAENRRLAILFVMDIGLAGVAAVMYLALEPYVRRRCPRVLIGWTRLLQGGWRDELVGSHSLAGVLVAVALSLLPVLQGLISIRSGSLPPVAPASRWVTLLGAREFVGGILSAFNSGILTGLFCTFIFFLMRLLLRRDWLAGAGLSLLLILGSLVNYRPVSMNLPIVLASSVLVSVLILVLVRLGLLALISMLVATQLLFLVPLTLDASKWYFGYTLGVLFAIFVLAASAFYFSLAGRSLLRDEVLG